MRCILFCLILLCPIAVQAEEKPAVTVAVMEFTSKGGVTQEQMDALGDMVANRIRGMGEYEVIGKSDIRAALQLAQQKQMLGCDSDSCMAEIGGALGVRWMVMGNISLFGKTYLLNLTLLDVERVKVAQGLSKTFKGGEDALVEAVPAAVKELMAAAHKDLTGEKAPEPPPEDKVKPKPASTPTKPPVRKKSEWFTFPDPEGAFVRVYVGGLVGFHGESISEPGDLDPVGRISATAELATNRNGPQFSIEGGYAFHRWLKVFGRVGGYLTTDDSERFERKAFELAVGVEAGIPLNSWAEPMVYSVLGVSFMNSEDKNQTDEVLRGTGILWDLGLGLDLFLDPHWFVGLRGGLSVRLHKGLEYSEDPVLPGVTKDDLDATLVGGFVGFSSGYQF